MPKTIKVEGERQDDLVSTIRDQMREVILTGIFRPGQKIAESDIARQMNVSRGPIREAARLLERQGLLVAKKNAGFFIRTMDRDRIDEIYELRVILQTAAVRLAVARMSDAELGVLEALLDRAKEVARSERGRDFVKDIIDFQQQLCRCSGNGRLASVFEEISDEIRLILSWVGIVYQRPVDILERFDPLIQAMKSRNEAWAAAAVEGFVRRSWDETIDKLNEDGDGDIQLTPARARRRAEKSATLPKRRKIG